MDGLLSNYTLISKIGEGSFSEVLKVKEKKTGIFLAAKRLTKFYATTEEAENCAELMILQKLEYHPNILSLVASAFDVQSGKLSLIFDLMDMSMYDFIKDRKKTLSETRCKHYMFQLAQGLNHLHRSGIFHRDIKPENILIRTDARFKNNAMRYELVQLADLGSVCNADFPKPHSAYISTRWYRAPECLLTSGYYGPKMDVWALGCCFFEILTLEPLFPGDNELDQLHKIHSVIGTPPHSLLERFKHRNVTFDFPKKKSLAFHNLVPMLSDIGVDVLKKCLVYHPDTRISAKKLLNHSYFEDLLAKKRVNNTANRLMSSSLTSSIRRKSYDEEKSLAARKSLNGSRASLKSDNTTRISTIRKLHEAQEKLNKQLERGWGMNKCPVKAKIMDNIKSSVHSSKKTMQ